MISLDRDPRLPDGERSWWRYLQRLWLENMGYAMSKREAKLCAYPARRKPERVNHVRLYRRLAAEKRAALLEREAVSTHSERTA